MITNIEIAGQPEFYVAGITVRTINKDGQSQKDIGALWTRFMNEGISQTIAGRVSDDTYCLYTDYETDYTGYYTALIGCKVSSPDQLPDGLTGLTVHKGKYKVFTLTGKFPENVHEAWQEIWRSETDRAYTVDFDLYAGNAKSFEETGVKIYLAIN